MKLTQRERKSPFIHLNDTAKPGVVCGPSKVRAAGYYVTLRLDPMIPIDGWEEAYTAFIQDVYRIFSPDQWTIGSLRYYRSLPMWTTKVGRDATIYQYAQEASREDGRKRVSISKRAELYGLAINTIRELEDKASIRLCKETLALYAKLGIEPEGCCYSTFDKNEPDFKVLRPSPRSLGDQAPHPKQVPGALGR